MIKRAAPTKATVLFLGESGVGKERFAQMLHNISKRADKPFVAVNCAAIPEQLIESELFGVERGGFSGATQSRPGRFERADGGTLFLDEISALSLIAQGKLLRALQESEIERIGDTRVRKVDVRVVAATNDDLRILVDAGRFREDLFYRLNVFPVNIPPLRERRADIPLLLDYFLDRYSRLHGRRVTGFSERALDALMAYAWPGNIREIENIVERGVILAPDDGAVDTPHLFVSGERVRGDERIRASEFRIGATGALQTTISNGIPPAKEPLDEKRLVEVLRCAIESNLVTFDGMEDLLVQTASDITHGNIAAAAKLLGATRARIAYRLDKIKEDKGFDPPGPRMG
jgi:transcriptional regulator with PAS, ATPase and Fis domain